MEGEMFQESRFPPMKCRRCKANAVVALPSHNSAFCADCFLEFFSRQVRKGIESCKLMTPEDRVLVALSGGLLAQYQGSATVDMGRGAIVIGLAAVIIGEVLLGKVFINFALKLLAAIIGAIIYYVVITLVLRLGLESTDLKLLTAVVVAIFLTIPYWKGKYFSRSLTRGGTGNA